MASNKSQPPKKAEPAANGGNKFLYLSEQLGKRVCAGKIGDRIGKVSDIVFALKEPYPEAVGIYMEFGWGKPTQFIPWDRVVKIEEDAVFVRPAEGADVYPPFVDQPGWIMADTHLIGRTIVDMDGRRTEVVNDVHLLDAKGRLVLVHVDTSFSGVLRRWGLGKFPLVRDDLISWKFVQPLSLEDASAADKVALSVTKKQIHELPSEDLADVLEELSGKEQEALFSALDSEKAAETLIEAEPRAQRQLIATIRKERAKTILGELSVAQITNLLSVLPHDDRTELLGLMPPEHASRVKSILSDKEAKARDLMTAQLLSFPAGTRVGDALAGVRRPGRDRLEVSYLYVTADDGKTLQGVVDLRELVLAPDAATLGEIMTSPVVTAEEDDYLDDLVEIFGKYQYRMIPVVGPQEQLLGIIGYNDIMKRADVRQKE